MILSGGSRGGALDLALHLSNALDNERVEIASVRGATSTNLYDAFREWEAISDCSNATKGFYSLSISPDPEQREWTKDEWQRAIEHTEKRLSLTGQPRAVVFHDKVGESDGQLRKHCHIVWSRISTKDNKLRAISDSNDRYKLRDATRELAQEFGLRIKRGRKSKEAYELVKSQGHNRDPETSEQRKAAITKLWDTFEDPKQFIIATNKTGYVIAKGDRRDFVILDRDGEIFSLPRQIEAVKTKQIRERLGNGDDLPTVEQAKEEQKIRRQQEAHEPRKPPQRRVDLAREQKLMAKLKRMAKRADTLHGQRRRQLKNQLTETKQRQSNEWEWMQRRFRKQTTKLITKRKRSEPKGLARRMRTLIGYETLLKWKHAQQDRDRARAFASRQADMKKSQANELERIEGKRDLIEKQERREAKSLERLSKKLAVSAERVRQEQERAQQLKRLKQQKGERIRFQRSL